MKSLAHVSHPTMIDLRTIHIYRSKAKEILDLVSRANLDSLPPRKEKHISQRELRVLAELVLVHPLITTFQKRKGEHYLIRTVCKNLALNNQNNLEILLIKAEQRQMQKITSLIVVLSK